MRVITIISFVLSSICFTVNAQNINIDSRGRFIDFTNVNANVNTDIEGSEYIDKNFTPIIITQYKNKIYGGRFNAFNGEIEVKLGENKVIALDNNLDFEIKFTTTNKVYRTEKFINEKGITKKGFLVVVTKKNEYLLLKEETIKFHEKIKAATSYDKSKPARYIREKDKYFIKFNSVVTYISQKKKDLFKTFPEQSGKLKSYIKKNNLNMKDEDDLIIIVNYLSTLTE